MEVVITHSTELKLEPLTVNNTKQKLESKVGEAKNVFSFSKTNEKEKLEKDNFCKQSLN